MEIINENFIAFKNKFQVDLLKLYETKYWCWSLRPAQVTIGAGILSLKRAETQLSKITEEESADFINIIRVIENTLTKTFSYQRINYLMLMMVDFQVHYHVIPRYKNEVYYLGKTWKDESFPKVPNIAGISDNIEVLSELALSIKNKLIH